MFSDRLIIAAFMLSSIGIHWLIYYWVKFKVDESTIIELFRESRQALSTSEIAERTNTKPLRVSQVCKKSRHIETYLQRKSVWCLRRKVAMSA